MSVLMVASGSEGHACACILEAAVCCEASLWRAAGADRRGDLITAAAWYEAAEGFADDAFRIASARVGGAA